MAPGKRSWATGQMQSCGGGTKTGGVGMKEWVGREGGCSCEIMGGGALWRRFGGARESAVQGGGTHACGGVG